MNKKILIFSIILLSLSIFVLADDAPPRPAFGGESNNESSDVTPDYTNTIEISEIKVDVDENKDTIRADREKIDEKAEEESVIEFEVEIKNLFNKTIEDIEVSATIEDIGREDIDDETEISKLSPGDSKKATLNFKLPLKIDDDTYDVDIKVRGVDEDKKIHTAEWKLRLEVKKEEHKLRVIDTLVSPYSISCSRYSDLTIRILNIGRKKETAKIEIKNDELGINLKGYDIELNTGTEYDAEYEKIFNLNIPNDAKPGTYPIHIKVYYNDNKFTATKDINILVKECEQTGEIEQKEEALVNIPPQQTQETTGIQEKKTQQPEETRVVYIYEDNLLLIILSIIVAGFIIFLIGAIIIKLRK